MFKSFNEYYEGSESNRVSDQQYLWEGRLIQFGLVNSDFQLDEMAVHQFGDEQLHDIPKAPVILDNNDIAYLHQFPTKFWRQALTYRYNQFPFQIKSKVDAGKKLAPYPDDATECVSEWRWVEIWSGDTCYEFFVDTKASAFWDKMTRPVNREFLRTQQIDPNTPEGKAADAKAREDYFIKGGEGGSPGGTGGFTFDRGKKLIPKPKEPTEDEIKAHQSKLAQHKASKKPGRPPKAWWEKTSHEEAPWVGEDYVGQTGTHMGCRVLSRWLEANADGWLGEHMKDCMWFAVDRGSGDRTSMYMPCRTGPNLKKRIDNMRSKMSEAAQSLDDDYDKACVKRVLPDLGNDAHGNLAMVIYRSRITKQGDRTVSGSFKDFESYYPSLFSGKIVDSTAYRTHANYKEALHQSTLAQHDSPEGKRAFAALATEMFNAHLEDDIKNKIEEIQKKMQDGTPEQVLFAQMDLLANKQSAVLMQHFCRQKGYDVPKMLKNAGINLQPPEDNMNEKQKNAYYTKVAKELDLKLSSKDKKDILHLLEEFNEKAKMQMRSIISDAKANGKVYDVWHWLMAYFNASGKYPKLYLTTHGLGTINPNKNQKGVEVGNPKNWKEDICPYFGVQHDNGEDGGAWHNYVLDFVKDLVEGEKVLIEKGPVVGGIIQCLARSAVRESPEGKLMKYLIKDWTQDVLMSLQYQTGTPECQDFLAACAEDNAEQIVGTGTKLWKWVMKKADEFVYSVWQLPFLVGRGSRRKRQKAGHGGYANVDDLAGMVSDEEKIKEMATGIAAAASVFKYRGTSSGWSQVYAKKIKDIFDFQKTVLDLVTQLQDADPYEGSAQSGAKATTIAKMQQAWALLQQYRKFYIAKAQAAGQAWNLSDIDDAILKDHLTKDLKDMGFGAMTPPAELMKKGASAKETAEKAAQQKKLEDAIQKATAETEPKKKKIWEKMGHLCNPNNVQGQISPELASDLYHQAQIGGKKMNALEACIVKKFWMPMLAIYLKDPESDTLKKQVETMESIVLAGDENFVTGLEQGIQKETGDDDYFISDPFEVYIMLEYIINFFLSKVKAAFTPAAGEEDKALDTESVGKDAMDKFADYVLQALYPDAIDASKLPKPGGSKGMSIYPQMIQRFEHDPKAYAEIVTLFQSKRYPPGDPNGFVISDSPYFPILEALVDAVVRCKATGSWKAAQQVIVGGPKTPQLHNKPATAKVTEPPKQTPEPPPAAAGAA